MRLLGAGGMGTVYLAEDLTLGRTVAVKLISEDSAESPESRTRLLREARAMATVDHPNVVRVYAYGEAEGISYVVMEYVEGSVLSERIRRESGMPYKESLQIVRQVAEALEAAWEKRVVHRDIKPSNILLDRRDRARVADFGLAKPVQLSHPEAPLTEQNSVLGTPQYLSPERARGIPEDFRADIYSLGVVLFEMLTGSQPFQGSTSLEIVAQLLHEPIPRTREKRADLPREADQLVDWMTRKDPAERPSSHAELIARIDTLLRSPSIPASQFDLGGSEMIGEPAADINVPSWELDLPPEVPSPRFTGPEPSVARPTGVVEPPTRAPVTPPPLPPVERPPTFTPAAPIAQAAPAPAAGGAEPVPKDQSTPGVVPTVSIVCPGCGRRHAVPLSRYPETGGRFPCPRCRTAIDFPPKSRWTRGEEKTRVPDRRASASGSFARPAAPESIAPAARAPTASRPSSGASKPPTVPTPLRRRKRPAAIRPLLLGVGALVVAALGLVVVSSSRRSSLSPPASLPPAATVPVRPAPVPEAEGETLGSASFRDYTARVSRPAGARQELLVLLRGGESVSHLNGDHFTIGSLDERGNPDPATQMGHEITGEGTPNLIVSETTGKSRCCVTYHVFDIGAGFREVSTLVTDNTKSYFKDLDDDGKLEFVTTDGTFAGWRGCPAGAPRPRVIFRFAEGRYRLAEALMEKDPPGDSQLVAIAERLRRAPSWRAGKEPPELTREMVDLIYTGQAFLAWRFCADAWSPASPGREKFLEAVHQRLAESPYGPEIRAMNTNVNTD